MLVRRGPVWRSPMAEHVLKNLPFLRNAPQRALEVRRYASNPCWFLIS